MPQLLLKNNVSTTLASGIASGATSATLTDATAFPAITGGDWYFLTLLDSAKIPEIVQVTAMAGNVITMVRAQEGTAARAFSSGASVRMALTKGVLDALLALRVAKAGDTYTGAHDFSGATAVSLPANTLIGNVSATEVAALDNITGNVQAQIDAEAAARTAADSAEAAARTAADSALQAQFAGKADLASPALTGTPTAPTAPAGSTGARIATLDFVNSAAMSPTLPGQTADGQTRSLLSKDGAAYWGTTSMVVPTSAALTALPTPTDGQTAVVFDSGLFRFDPLSTEPVDLETCFAPDAGNGRWFLELPSEDFSSAHAPPMVDVFSAQASSTLASVVAVSTASQTVDVTGARQGMAVVVTPSVSLGTRLLCYASVASTDSVTVTVANHSAASATLPSGLVWQVHCIA